MAKRVHDAVLDGAFAVLDDGTTITVCSQEPTTRTEAITTYMLASDALTGADYTVADGNASGRKCTIAQQTNVPITNSGTATHIAICDGTRLLYVTTCTSQALTAGGTVTIPAWRVEIADPA